MQSFEANIEAKVKTNPIAIVSPDDFQVGTKQVFDESLILTKPDYSLYCLDHEHQQAIFVKTSSSSDLLQKPFYYIAQYEAAERLITVPYETLHTLAKQVEIQQEQILLFYSTGCCGSTLMSHVLNSSPSVMSFSEPDVFSQLVILRNLKLSADSELTTLLQDCLMIMSANARQHGFHHYAFKFRSFVLSISDLLYEAIPNTKTLFMYRNALTWANSMGRAFGPSDDDEFQTILHQGFRFMVPSVNDYLNDHSSITWMNYIARMWVSSIENAKHLKQEGAGLVIARYEDLKANPEDVIERFLNQCGLSMPNSEVLSKILTKDSQEGTQASQANQESEKRLTALELAKLKSLISELSPQLTPDVILT